MRRHSRRIFRGNFRSEADSDVIYGVVVEPSGMKIRVKFGDSRLNRSRDKRLPYFVTNDDNDNDDYDPGRRTL